MATTERIDSNAKAAVACLEETFGPIMGPSGPAGEFSHATRVPKSVTDEQNRDWTLAQAQVYATLALVDEVRELRKVLSDGRKTDA